MEISPVAEESASYSKPYIIPCTGPDEHEHTYSCEHLKLVFGF